MSTLTDTTVLRARDLERFNFAPDARSFDCKFIEPGIISYRDQGGGIELLRKETIDRCIQSSVGNPLTVGHIMVDAENRLNVEEGIVQEWYYDVDDGWYHVRGVAETDKAKTLMKVKRPSCGYRVTSFGPGGVYHGIRYDAEITGIEFNHLAIVDKPRYEGATFRLNTIVSNPENMNLIKLFKKLVTRENGADGKPVESTKVESTEVPATTEVEIDGKMVRLNELADVWMKQTADAVRANGDDEVEIDGKRVKMNELVECYRKNAARVNAAAAPVVAEPAAKTESGKTEPAASAAAAAAVDPGKASFFTLHSARENSAPVVTGSTDSGSLRDRVARGAKRY
jgi:hypothetical protein